jgi:hypothetical protein
VDNAQVSIGSEGFYSGTVGRGSWGETDHNGDIEFVLGDSQNYYIQVFSTLGTFPSSGYALIISNSVTGQHYFWEHQTPGYMPALDATELPSGTTGDYILEVGYELPCDVMNGRDYYASPYSEYAEPVAPGSLDFFAASAAEMDEYLAGNPFDAYEVQQGVPAGGTEFFTPSAGDWYAVLSGAGHQGFATLAEVTVNLWQIDGFGCPGQGGSSVQRLSVFPNPASAGASVDFTAADGGPVVITAFDAAGRRVGTVYGGTPGPGSHRMTWDLTAEDGSALPSGIYVVRMETASGTSTARMAILR